MEAPTLMLQLGMSGQSRGSCVLHESLCERAALLLRFRRASRPCSLQHCCGAGALCLICAVVIECCVAPDT